MMEYLVGRYLEDLDVDPASVEMVNIPKLTLRLDLLMEGSDIQAAILPDPLAIEAESRGCGTVIDDTKLGTGMPAFNNDEVIIPSFIEKGVKKEDAYCYSAIGCVETAVPGKWGYRCTGMSCLNFPRILLMVMNNGIDMTSGRRFVKDYGNFRDMESFDELMKAWDGAIRELTRASVIVENAIDIASEREVPDILCSCLTQDCLGRGKISMGVVRTTYLIDESGVIIKAFDKVKAADNPAQMLGEL